MANKVAIPRKKGERISDRFTGNPPKVLEWNHQIHEKGSALGITIFQTRKFPIRAFVPEKVGEFAPEILGIDTDHTEIVGLAERAILIAAIPAPVRDQWKSLCSLPLTGYLPSTGMWKE